MHGLLRDSHRVGFNRSGEPQMRSTEFSLRARGFKTARVIQRDLTLANFGLRVSHGPVWLDRQFSDWGTEL